MKDLRNTHRRNAPSNKTKTFTKSMNGYILVVGTFNQLFSRGSYAEKLFSKE